MENVMRDFRLYGEIRAIKKGVGWMAMVQIKNHVVRATDLTNAISYMRLAAKRELSFWKCQKGIIIRETKRIREVRRKNK